MTETDLPSHADVGAQAEAMRLGTDASELHGLLCGFLSGGATPSRSEWVALVMADSDLDDVERDGPLDQLFLATGRLLEAPDFGFELLLPDPDLSVAERGDALLSWCRGFLGGFGLAAGAEPPLSEESRDALGDLARIASSDLAYEEPDADEDALEEVAEFVRVAVLLLHSDCVLGPRHRRSLN